MGLSKTSLHVIVPSQTLDSLIRSAPWTAVKTVDTVEPLATARTVGIPIRIFRKFGIESMSSSNAVASILSFNLVDVTHIQLACEAAVSYDASWQLNVMEGLLSGGYSGRFLVGGFSTGNPTTIVGNPPHFPELEQLYSLFRRPDVDLALNAYTGILVLDPRWTEWAPDTVFRPTMIHDDLARQGIEMNVIVTESGGDNVQPVLSGDGWQTRDWSSDEYLSTLQAIDADDQTHPWLLARCVFTSGPTVDWSSYDIEPIENQLSTYVTNQSKVPKEAPVVQPTMKFLDLSKVNAISSWTAIAENYDGVIIQATFGGNQTTGVQATFAPYWAAAKEFGLKRIAYHYLYPQYNTPQQEAANFLSHVVLEPGDGWAVDVEEQCEDPAGYSNTFMQIVEQGLQSPRNWYSYLAYIEQYGITAASVGNPHLWLADYTNVEPSPPSGWSSIAIWQHTSNAVVPGIAGVVDEDYLYLTSDQYAALCKPFPEGGLQEVITVTPSVVAAARARLGALGGQLVQGGAIETELISRFALGQANPKLSTQTPTPVVGSETGLPNGKAYAMLDSGEILAWENGKLDNPEESQRASIIQACGWNLR